MQRRLPAALVAATAAAAAPAIWRRWRDEAVRNPAANKPPMSLEWLGTTAQQRSVNCRNFAANIVVNMGESMGPAPCGVQFVRIVLQPAAIHGRHRSTVHVIISILEVFASCCASSLRALTKTKYIQNETYRLAMQDHITHRLTIQDQMMAWLSEYGLTLAQS